MRPDQHLAGSAVAPLDPSGAKLQDNMRSAFHMAYRHPPRFPIVVPGRVIEAVTIESMRKLDVYVPEEF